MNMFLSLSLTSCPTIQLDMAWGSGGVGIMVLVVCCYNKHWFKKGFTFVYFPFFRILWFVISTISMEKYERALLVYYCLLTIAFFLVAAITTFFQQSSCYYKSAVFTITLKKCQLGLCFFIRFRPKSGFSQLS